MDDTTEDSRAMEGPDTASRSSELPLSDERESLRGALEAALGVPFTKGNHVQRLLNGDEIFPAMLTAVRSARRSVRFLTFIYWDGEIAEQFADALAERARAGVRVEALLDDVGSWPMPQELVERMTNAGVELRRFRPLRRLRIGRINHRTHRKVLVCDERVGFTGGVGIATPWTGSAETPADWRETHFEVRGPAVRGLEAAFFDNWKEAGGSLSLEESSGEVPESGGTSDVQVLCSNGRVASPEVQVALEVLLRRAERRLRIETAYFVPDEAFTKGLVDAAARGVRVEIMLPGTHTDQRLCNLAGRTAFAPLLDAGVELLRYERTMLHAKVLTMDGHLAFVGSPNMNQRSSRRDDEVAMVVLDPALVAVLDRDFDEDARHAERIDPERWPKRGAIARTREWFASFLRSEL